MKSGGRGKRGARENGAPLGPRASLMRESCVHVRDGPQNLLSDCCMITHIMNDIMLT